MRLRCWFCGKTVSTEVPEQTVIRACLVCPECIEAGRVQIPEPEEVVGDGRADQPPKQ